MTYKTHILFAEAVAYPLAYLLPTNFDQFLTAVAIGALLPDLDHLNSYISKRIPILPYIIALFTKHRGFTHSIKGIATASVMLILATLTHWVPLAVAAGFLLGYILHIAGDAMTISGIKEFCCSKNLYLLPKPLRFKTGSAKEHIYFMFFTILLFLEWKLLG